MATRVVSGGQGVVTRRSTRGQEPLYRRAKREGGETQAPPQVRKPTLPKVGPILVCRRLVRLVLGLVAYAGLWAWDIVRGKRTSWDQALRVRRVAEALGGNALRLMEELAQRNDLVPYEIYYALTMAREWSPPLPFEESRRVLEAATGRPLEEDFDRFDPEPIVSDSVSCVYQAVLRNGDRVAVLVLRPDIRRVFAADIAALQIVIRVMEVLTIVRPGYLGHLHQELRLMIAKALDLQEIARFHRLFRRYARKARLSWFSVVKVYHRFTSDDVLVTEFVSGVWLDEVLSAVESENPEGARWLEEMGVDPARVGRRLLEGAWWSVFEMPFFEGAPRARSIVVAPGDRIVFVSLRDCGGVSDRRSSLALEVLERMSRHDVSGAVEALVQLLAPLPYIEVSELTKALEARLWHQLFLMEDRRSSWVDRTSIGIWIATLEVAWEYKIPVRQEVVRMFRSFMLFDGLAGRLKPGVRLFKEFARYQAREDRRSARALRKQVRGLTIRRLGAKILADYRDASTLLDRIRFFVAALTERVPVQFHSLSGKAAYVASVVLNTGLIAGAVGLGGYLAMRVHEAVTGETLGYQDVAGFVSAYPVPFNVGLGVLLLITVRRILFRLQDKEQS